MLASTVTSGDTKQEPREPLLMAFIMWCVDWLRTATVYTKQTKSSPRWDWGASDNLILPYSFSLSRSLQPAIRQDQRCMQLLLDALTLDGGLDWTGLGAATPVCPPRARAPGGSSPWRTCYMVATSKQGIIASLSLTCSNTAIAELTTGSNTPPTDSTDLRLTMQHKSGTVGMLFFVTRLIAIGYLVIRADVVTRNLDCNWASNQWLLAQLLETMILGIKWTPFTDYLETIRKLEQ